MSSPRTSRTPSSPRSPRSPRCSRRNGPSTPKTPKLRCKSPSLPAISPSGALSPISPLPSLAFPLPKLLEYFSGLPTIGEFTAIQEDYLADLSWMKRDKALIDTKTYRDVLHSLRDPENIETRSAQFRFWVRKTFQLESPISPPVASVEGKSQSPAVLHEGKRVALKEDLYSIVCTAHLKCGHGGRDTTVKEVREIWRFVPKELVARFVKVCPTCTEKKARRGFASPEKPKRLMYESDEDDCGRDSDDEHDFEQRITMTPRASSRIQADAPKLDLDKARALRGEPGPRPRSLPRLLISPVSELPPSLRPFPLGDNLLSDPPTSGSTLVANGAASSNIDVPFGSPSMELLMDFTPAPLARRPSMLRPGAPTMMSRRPSADDIRRIMNQHGEHKLISRARSMEAFRTPSTDGIPLDPALALYPAPPPPKRSEASTTGSRAVIQRPGPINVQVANAAFRVKSAHPPSRASSALSPSWMPSAPADGDKSGSLFGTPDSGSMPGLSRTSTGTEETNSFPPTPNSAASVWSQDSAPNSAVFWDVNARDYAAASSGGQLDFPQLLMEPSTFALLTLHDREGKMERSESLGKKSPDANECEVKVAGC